MRTRGRVDEAIAIDEVKRFIAQQDLDAETRYIPKKVVPSTKGFFPEKIAIIGGGPAGLSCAFYLAEKGYSPTIFEKNEKAGGMLTYGIPSFKLEKDVIQAEIDIIEAMGVEIKTGVEVGKDITIQQLRDQGYKAFYIAIGCQGGRKAGVPGEDAQGVATAVDFLRESAAKEAYDIEGDVVVIGGGNVAIDVARVSKRCGDVSVSMYCLESRDTMPASLEEIEEAKKKILRSIVDGDQKKFLQKTEKYQELYSKNVFLLRMQMEDLIHSMMKMIPLQLHVNMYSYLLDRQLSGEIF